MSKKLRGQLEYADDVVNSLDTLCAEQQDKLLKIKKIYEDWFMDEKTSKDSLNEIYELVKDVDEKKSDLKEE